MAGLNAVKKENPDFTLRGEVFNSAYPEALPAGFLWHAPVVGLDDIQMVAGTRVHGADCGEAEGLSAAEMDGRRQLQQMLDLLHKHTVGGKRVRLAALPGHIGIRQTRQVASLHRLTEAEVLGGTRFDDAIANGSYRVDVHSQRGEGLVFRYLDGREVEVFADGHSDTRRWRDEQATDPVFYQIPYRCLVPRGSRNLLVAGRCIDADEGAYGAVRVMVNCSQTGQAAGTAAWLALQDNVAVSDVDTAALRRVLGEAGALVI
jgi:hypothetical protein